MKRATQSRARTSRGAIVAATMMMVLTGCSSSDGVSVAGDETADASESPSESEAPSATAEPAETEVAAPEELEPLTITIGSHDASYLTLFVGRELGYFEDEGVDLDIQVSGGNQLPSLISGQADISASAIPAPFGPINEGQPLKLLGLRYAGGIIAVVAAAPGIDDFADCGTLATFFPGGGTYMWATALKNSFGHDALEFRTANDFGSIASLLASGQTDCANGTHGLFQTLVDEGRATIVVDPLEGDLPEELASIPDSGFFALPEVIEEKRGAIEGFFRASLRTDEWVTEHDTAELVELAQRSTPEFREVEPDALAAQFELNNSFKLENGGLIDEDTYDRTLEFMRNGGHDFLEEGDERFTYSTVVDLSMLEAALESVD